MSVLEHPQKDPPRSRSPPCGRLAKPPFTPFGLRNITTNPRWPHLFFFYDKSKTSILFFVKNKTLFFEKACRNIFTRFAVSLPVRSLRSSNVHTPSSEFYPPLLSACRHFHLTQIEPELHTMYKETTT